MSEANHSPKFSFVVPFLDEEKNIVPLIERLDSNLNPTKIEKEYIFVSDGSRDSSDQILEGIIENRSDITLVTLSRNFGKDAAIFAGLEHSSGDAVVTLDADLQHPPEVVLKLIDNWLETKADIVEAKKTYRGKESFSKKFLASFFYRAFHKATGLNLEGQSDFKLLSRKVVNELLEFDDRIPFYRGLTSWVGFERREVNFSVPERHDGKGKFSMMSLFSLALRVMIRFSSKPLYIIPATALGFLVVSIFLATRMFLIWMEGGVVGGIPTIVFVLLFSSGVILFELSVLSFYVAQIFDQVSGSPRYVVRSVVRHDSRIQSYNKTSSTDSQERNLTS